MKVILLRPPFIWPKRLGAGSGPGLSHRPRASTFTSLVGSTKRSWDLTTRSSQTDAQAIRTMAKEPRMRLCDLEALAHVTYIGEFPTSCLLPFDQILCVNDVESLLLY